MYRLKEMRNSKQMTQAEVAEAVGVAAVTYRSWESGKYMISFEQACQLADLYGCTLDELAGRQVHRAEVIPMAETPMHARLREAFTLLNREGREFLAAQAEALTHVSAFSEASPFAVPAAG